MFRVRHAVKFSGWRVCPKCNQRQKRIFGEENEGLTFMSAFV